MKFRKLHFFKKLRIGGDFMSVLTNLYLSSNYSPIIMVLCYWIFWPGLMFIMAPIFESHKVYLGKGQSRMFFPGDFMLGIGVVLLIGICAHNKIECEFIYGPWYWVITGCIHLVIAFIIRGIDTKRYPKRSRRSPTKIAHDFCGFFVSFWLLAAIGIPQLIWAIFTKCFSNCMTEWLVFLAVALFFIAMIIWDVSHPASSKDLLLMHPDDWKPIWKKNGPGE